MDERMQGAVSPELRPTANVMLLVFHAIRVFRSKLHGFAPMWADIGPGQREALRTEIGGQLQDDIEQQIVMWAQKLPEVERSRRIYEAMALLYWWPELHWTSSEEQRAIVDAVIQRHIEFVEQVDVMKLHPHG